MNTTYHYTRGFLQLVLILVHIFKEALEACKPCTQFIQTAYYKTTCKSREYSLTPIKHSLAQFEGGPDSKSLECN